MSATFDAYLEFTCADQATQSELWEQGIQALLKNPPPKFAPKQKPVYAQTMSTEQKRIPGTYETGDRVRLRALSHVEGTVEHDNRKVGGRNVWVHFDHDDSVCCDPSEIISTGVGK